MKLRYYTERKQFTAAQLNEFGKSHGLPMMEAKRILSKQVGPVLQYYDEDCDCWFDVEHVTEYVE